MLRCRYGNLFLEGEQIVNKWFFSPIQFIATLFKKVACRDRIVVSALSMNAVQRAAVEQFSSVVLIIHSLSFSNVDGLDPLKIK